MSVDSAEGLAAHTVEVKVGAESETVTAGCIEGPATHTLRLKTKTITLSELGTEIG